MKNNNRWKGEPRLETHQLVSFYTQCLKLIGRNLDKEFEEYKCECLLKTRDEVVDVNEYV